MTNPAPDAKDEYRKRWQEAEKAAALRLDEHTRTMIVMLENQVKALHQRCQECWAQADEQKAVIGGLLVTIDELKATDAHTTKRLDESARKFLALFKQVQENETKLGDGRLGE